MPDPTTMPYTVEILPAGPFKRPFRRYPSGRGGEMLSEDEIGVWNYVQRLEAELAATGMVVVPIDPALTAAVAEYAAGAEPEKKKGKK